MAAVLNLAGALIGGLIGAAVTYRGFAALNIVSIVNKILLPLILSPLSGFLAGYLLMLGLIWWFRNSHPSRVNKALRKLQILSSAFMATSHGMNDAQKTMGIITLALFVGHYILDLTVPTWVKLSCALMMAVGTAAGGWKIVKTMGHKIFKLEPIHGFLYYPAHSRPGSLLTAPVHFHPSQCRTQDPAKRDDNLAIECPSPYWRIRRHLIDIMRGYG
jgi:phosphate/sulfate permease